MVLEIIGALVFAIFFAWVITQIVTLIVFKRPILKNMSRYIDRTEVSEISNFSMLHSTDYPRKDFSFISRTPFHQFSIFPYYIDFEDDTKRSILRFTKNYYKIKRRYEQLR